MINTSAYSFASQAYPMQVEKIISVFEGCLGAGMMMGPIIGSFVYNAVGFSDTFFIFGIVMAPISFIVLFALPKPIDVRENLRVIADDEEHE